MTAGRRNPSMLAAYNCVPIIVNNTIKEKKKKSKKLHATSSIVYLYNHTLIVTD